MSEEHIETFFLAFPHFQYKFCLSNFYLMTSFRAKKQGETMLLEKNPTETKVNICHYFYKQPFIDVIKNILRFYNITRKASV